MSHGDTERTED